MVLLSEAAHVISGPDEGNDLVSPSSCLGNLLYFLVVSLPATRSEILTIHTTKSIQNHSSLDAVSPQLRRD